MVPAQAEAGYGSFIVEEHLMRVDYAHLVLEELCAAALEGLYRFRHGGIEVGGVLYGTLEDGLVRVLAWRPLSCEHAYGPRFVLSDKDRAGLKRLIEQPEAELRGLQAVGWYHSHTRSEVALSPRDLEIYNRYFPDRWQVALVLRPDHFGPTRAGFFFREANGAVRAEQSYEEILIHPRRRPRALAPEPEPKIEPEPEPEPEAPPPARRPSGAAPSAPAAGAVPVELPLPSFAQVAPRRSRKWLWLAAALVVVAAAAFGLQRYQVSHETPPPLSLWVVDVGGQLLIEWDRTAAPIRNAQRGALEIRDGGEHMEIQMDGDRLREGSVDYVRQTETVDVRLRVERPGRPPAQEYIRFLGQPVRRGGDPEQAKQIEQLKAELEKAQVAQKDAQLRRLRGTAAVKPVRQP